MSLRLRLLPLLVVALLLWPFAPAGATRVPQPGAPAHDPQWLYTLAPGTRPDAWPWAMHAAPPPDVVRPAGTPPAWSRLAYSSYLYDNWNLFLASVDGTVTGLIATAATEMDPSLSNGNPMVAFASDQTGDLEIYSIRDDGTQQQQLTYAAGDDFNPRLSPDGTRIAFQSYRNGNSDIYVMDANGANPVQLTTDSEYDGQPSWSPDGTRIAFTSRRSGSYAIWVISADGSNPTQLTSGATVTTPSWSPLGNQIAYAADGDGDGFYEIWLMNADGSNPQRLYDDGPEMDRWAPAWSPDGQWLAVIETSWIYYQGHWYWTSSYMRLREISTGATVTPVSDDRIWEASWAWLDTTPPDPCTVSVDPLQRWSMVSLSWSAHDATSGISQYDVQVRMAGSGTWQPFLSAVERTSALYPGPYDGSLEFRCRARDGAGNWAGWAGTPIASTIIDAVRPDSHVQAVGYAVRGPQVSLQFSGSDAGTGIVSYDLLARDGPAGDWAKVQAGLPGPGTTFIGTIGHTYDFHSQARDGAGHTETWEPSPDSTAVLYATLLTGTVADNRDNSALASAIRVEPAPVYTPTLAQPNAYQFDLGSAASHVLSIAPQGYGALPDTAIATTTDSRFDVTLRPRDDLLVNGGFESGTLQGWSVSGTGAGTVASARHTGALGLAIARTTTDTTALSQTVALPGSTHAPTVSFWYQLPVAPTGGAFVVTVAAAPGASTVLSTTAATAGWTHAWADLSTLAGQTVTVTFALSGGPSQLQLDEVTLGSWETPQVGAVSPAAWPAGQPIELLITGTNFIATPTLYLNATAITAVTWVSPTRLTALVPAALPHGIYTVRIANPGGAANILPNAVAARRPEVLLPLVAWQRAFSDRLGANNDWLTLNYDNQHTGDNTQDPGATRYALAWQYTMPYAMGLRRLQQVAVGDGVLIAANDARLTQSALLALNAETGQELWRYDFVNKNSVNPGTIAYGNVYFQENYHSGDTYLFNLDLYTGAMHWRSPFSAQWEMYYAPLVVDESVYINGGYFGGIYAFNAATGAELWYRSLPQYDEWAPAYQGGLVYSWVAGRFTAHYPSDGTAAWTLNFDWPWATYAMLTAPVLGPNVAIVGSPAELMAIDLTTHAVRWSAPGDYGYTIPALAGDTVYGINAGILQEYRLADGQRLWNFSGTGIEHTPIVAGDYLYISSRYTTYVIDRRTHAVVWQADHGGWLTVAGGFLYIAGSDSTVYAYRAQEP